MNVLSLALFTFVVITLPLHEAMACGYPIEVHDRASGELVDWFDNPPAAFVLPPGACLSRNYADCNSLHIFWGTGAGYLLFSDSDRFCSDEDRAHLRWLYIKVHAQWFAFFGAFMACAFWLLRKSRQGSPSRGITTGASGGKAANDNQKL